MKLYSFYTDLRGLQFAESNNTAWLQALPIGKYKHPIYGEIEFTEQRVERFAKNVNEGVVGTELDIDYDHKAFTGKAAGWVKKAESRGPAGLHILVEFTPEAVKAIRNGEYRYFSPEFADKWTHPKTGKEFEDVLRGGGLTNRPFLKDILPVNLSELSFEIPTNKEEGVTPKELRAALGLAEAATDEEVRAKLTELTKPKVEDEDKGKDEDKDKANPSEALLSELRKLTEANPAMKALADLVEKQTEQIKQQGEALLGLQQQLKLTEVNRKLADADKGKIVLAPAAREAFTKILLGEDVPSQAEQFLKLMAEGTALVETGERGAHDPTKLGETDAEKQWDAAVAKLMSENKELGYADACNQIASENPTLFAAYREASTAFKA